MKCESEKKKDGNPSLHHPQFGSSRRVGGSVYRKNDQGIFICFHLFSIISNFHYISFSLSPSLSLPFYFFMMCFMPPHEKQTNSRNFRTPSSEVSKACFAYQTTFYHPSRFPDDFVLHSCYKYKINAVTLPLTSPYSFASYSSDPTFRQCVFFHKLLLFRLAENFSHFYFNKHQYKQRDRRQLETYSRDISVRSPRTADCRLWTAGFAAATNPSDIWHLPHSELYQTEPNKPN